MAGSAAEYERMALAAMEKAADDVSDTSYHLRRSQIFALLAQASAEQDSVAEDTPPRRTLRAADQAG